MVLHDESNLIVLFHIQNSIMFDKIPNTTGWNGATNDDGACFTDGASDNISTIYLSAKLTGPQVKLI